ncbi:G-rich sequence factor 1 [Trichomycterus rosablanca]|uniref:G-rich sequence factor 1 n=1 Tax=Trichomycterus rosablanca TaxID=2290929 RepID=UPI002F356C7C
MAVCGRTQFSVLVRCFRRTPSTNIRRILQPNQHLRSTAPHARDTHRWSASPALNKNPGFIWATQHRALSSDIPFKEDEYPPLPDYNPDQESQQKEVFIVRVKGLPWSCGAEDLMRFFSECRIRGGANGIHLMHHRNGKPNGQAFVEMEHEEDVSKALEMHRQYLGPRYVEVYEVTNKDAESILKGTDDSPTTDGVVRLRGLPFNCTEEQVIQFFSGLDVVKDGVTLVTDRLGRSSGDAFVQFASREMAGEALKKDREVIGNRYIEVFPSKKSEIQTQYGRGRGDDSNTACRPQRTGTLSLPANYIHMRGLPYHATAEDVINFFHPIRVAKVLIEFGPDGRPCGEAEAHFTTHQDAVAAMTKDKQHIQDRYIELFLNSA